MSQEKIIVILEIFKNQNLHSNKLFQFGKIWDRNFVHGTSKMEPDSGKIKGIGDIKQIQKRKNGSMMSVHAECEKRTFSVLAVMYFLSDTVTLIPTG